MGTKTQSLGYVLSSLGQLGDGVLVGYANIRFFRRQSPGKLVRVEADEAQAEVGVWSPQCTGTRYFFW